MTIRDWMDQGTGLFLATVDRLDDGEFEADTDLPGWTRGHIVAHVHYNAEALRRLINWASTGVEARMYEGPEQRAIEIEHGVNLPVQQLRSLVHESAESLTADMGSLTETEWGNSVVTAQGRTVPATEIPWMRVRELFVHAVDLGKGIGFGDFPDEVNAALAVDVVRKRAASGEAATLAEWLTGREATAPLLGRWL